MNEVLDCRFVDELVVLHCSSTIKVRRLIKLMKKQIAEKMSVSSLAITWSSAVKLMWEVQVGIHELVR